MAEQSLQGKVAIVTGAGRGMGRAISLALAEAGARVAMNDVDADVLEDAANDARAIGGNDAILALPADLTQEDAPAKLVADAIAGLGGLHILINNAGIGPETIRSDHFINPVKFWEMDISQWKRGVAVNATAPFLTALAAVKHLTAQGWGRIINVTTSLDTMIRPGFTIYGPPKAANEAFVAIMAQELADTGITANVLIPGGPVNTRMFPPVGNIKREDLIQPDVMAVPVVWLASEASNGWTGRRLIAGFWDASLPPREAADKASDPAAWPQLGGKAIMPGSAG